MSPYYLPLSGFIKKYIKWPKFAYSQLSSAGEECPKSPQGILRTSFFFPIHNSRVSSCEVYGPK